MLQAKEIKEEKPICYVISYGGSGSTMLNYYLAKTLNLTSYHVHIRIPFPAVPLSSRIVFIYANPVQVVISLFARFPATNIYQNLQCSKQGPSSLEEYATEGRDAFELETYFRNYISPSHPRSYPIAFIKYEYLWDNLDALQKFIGLQEVKKMFPQKQPRTPYSVKAGIVQKLEKIYESLIAQQAQLPNFWVN